MHQSPKIATEINPSQPVVLDSYIPPEHPMIDVEIKHYAFDPKVAGTLLETLGWLDEDSDPAAPASGTWGDGD